MFSYNAEGQPVIQLTQADYENCVKIIELKEEAAQKRKAAHRFEASELLSVAINLCGALGEQAISNYFGCPYVFTAYDPNAYDVLGYEVRATYYENGCLLTHAADDKNYGDKPGRYIFVTIDQKTLSATIRGYSTLTRCNERAGNYQNSWRYPCYAMPQNQLWPINMLPASDELLAFRQTKAVA